MKTEVQENIQHCEQHLRPRDVLVKNWTDQEPEYVHQSRISTIEEFDSRMIFYTHRDGETIDYYHPVASFVQGSLAEDRQKSQSRAVKDRREFERVRKINRKHRIPFIQLLEDSSCYVSTPEEGTQGVLSKKLSLLGASYPSFPGLGVYLRGIRILQGKNEFKKIFDLLFFISSLPDLKSYYKFLLLEPIGKILYNRIGEGKWIETDRLLYSLLGINELAYDYGEEQLNYNRGAIEKSLRNGRNLASLLHIEFYTDTSMYKTKIRRRGYARSSPRVSLSSKYIREANTSEEALRAEGLQYEQEGVWVMDEKPDIENLIFNIFKNSLEAFEAYQQEEKKRRARRLEARGSPDSEEEVKSDISEDPIFQLEHTPTKGSNLK